MIYNPLFDLSIRMLSCLKTNKVEIGSVLLLICILMKKSIDF